MYDSFEEHIEDLAEDFHEWMEEKYYKGQKEHGGKLWEHDDDWYIDNAIAEAIDMCVYLFTLRRVRDERSATQDETSPSS